METIFFDPAQEFNKGQNVIIASIVGTECNQYTAGSLDIQRCITENKAQLVVVKWETTYDDLAKLNPDGLLLPGGVFENDGPRSNAYLEAIKYAEQYKLPTLGICAGMQMMARHVGAKLESLPNPDGVHRQIGVHNAHGIKCVGNSILTECGYSADSGVDNLVNSRHREAIFSQPLKNARPIAWSDQDDNVIEAMEFEWSKFAIGIQWHPENLAMSGLNSQVQQSKKLFKAFVNAAVK